MGGRDAAAPHLDGAIYAGLLFPIAVCVVTIVVSAIWIRETKDHKLDV